MKTVKKYLLGAALLSVAVLTGCKDKMTELNTDPNIVTSADLREQFYSATRFFMSNGSGHTSARMRGMGSVLQHFAHSGIDESTRVYGVSKTDVANPWPTATWENLYGSQKSGVLLDNLINTYDEIYTTPDDQERYSEIRAISRLMLTYLYWSNLDGIGAIVHSQAFKGISEGITRPEYDLYHEVYQELIDVVKTEVIDVLKQPAGSLRVSLGRHDSFYGYTLTVTPGVRGSVVAQRNNADEQRALWLKFANTFRLRMAHRLIDMNTTLFDQVLADCLNPANGGMMESSADNCYMIYGWNNDNFDHQDGTGFLRSGSRASLAFVNTLRVLDDPRMHLLLRSNLVDTTFNRSEDFGKGALVNNHNTTQTYDYGPDYEYMFKHFPDSLTRYGDLLKIGNIYQGISVSPEAWEYTNGVIYGRPNSGKVPTNSTIGFEIVNPNGEAAYISPDSGEEAIPAGTKKVSKSIYIASFMQSRYFNRLGGAASYYLDVPQPDAEVRKQVRLTTNIMTYDEHCFRMAMIALKKGSSIAGKDANTWYQEGIRMNMRQLYLDALRMWVPITWSEGYALIRYYKFDKTTGTFETTLTNVNGDGTLNANGNFNITPYALTEQMIDDYITSLGALGSVNDPLEDIGIQAWIAMYQQPEEAWAFYKQTGYPQMVRVEPVTNTSKNPQLPTIPALEKPYSASGAPMFVPRHGTLPKPGSENTPNFDKMRAAYGQAPGYGTTYEDLTGRIFWDQMNPEYVGAN